MKYAVPRTLLVLFGIAVLVQLVPVTRSNPPVDAEVEAPAGVRAILSRSCYDCHSHRTAWPWYSAVAPVSWIVAHDVREGRAELNFSTWSRVPAGRRAAKIGKICEVLAEGEMPPWYYPVVHPRARLSAPDRATLGAWAAQIRR